MLTPVQQIWRQAMCWPMWPPSGKLEIFIVLYRRRPLVGSFLFLVPPDRVLKFKCGLPHAFALLCSGLLALVSDLYSFLLMKVSQSVFKVRVRLGAQIYRLCWSLRNYGITFTFVCLALSCPPPSYKLFGGD